MKVLVQLKTFINGVEVKGRKAWIVKDDNNNLTIGNIYKDKDTASSDLTEYDYISLKAYESQGLFKVIKIVQ